MPGRMRGGPTEIAGVQLMQNEAVLEDVNPAWSAYVGSLLFGTVLLLGALAEAAVTDSQNDAGAAAVMGIVVFGVIFGYAFYRRSRTHYIVTDSRVIKRTGILLNSSTEEAGYEMITGVGVDASRFQSLFGNGTVNVATSGGVGTIELTGAPDAQELANLIRERHPTLGARGRGAGGGPAPGGQPQGRGAPQGGRGQPGGGQPQGRGAGQGRRGQGERRQRDERRQGGQPRDVDGARGAEGPRQRGGQSPNQPRQGGQRGGQPQGRGEPSKRERRQQRADDERRAEQRRRDDSRREQQRGESGRSDRTRSGRADAGNDRRRGDDRPPESDGPVDRTPSSGGGPLGEDARDGGADPSRDERRPREDGDEDDEDGPAWDPDGR